MEVFLKFRYLIYDRFRDIREVMDYSCNKEFPYNSNKTNFILSLEIYENPIKET